MIDAEITDGKVVLIQNEGAGRGPLNVELPEMLHEHGFSLLGDAFESNPTDADGNIREEVIPEDVGPLVEFMEDNFLSDQPAYTKLKAHTESKED
jgi:hypothetical protein